MKRECFTPSSGCLMCRTVYRRQLHTKSFNKEFGLSFKPCWRTFEKDAVFVICNFTVECCKPVIGQTIDKKQANNAHWTTGELLSHFSSKIRLSLYLLVDPQTAHWYRNTAMFKTTMMSQSGVLVPFLPLNSAGILETFLRSLRLFSYFQLFYSFSWLRKKILHKFSFKRYMFTYCCLKVA